MARTRAQRPTKRLKTEETDADLNTLITLNADTLVSIAHYLSSEELLNIALTSRYFGGVVEDGSLSLMEEVARKIILKGKNCIRDAFDVCMALFVLDCKSISCSICPIISLVLYVCMTYIQVHTQYIHSLISFSIILKTKLMLRGQHYPSARTQVIYNFIMSYHCCVYHYNSIYWLAQTYNMRTVKTNQRCNLSEATTLPNRPLVVM